MNARRIGLALLLALLVSGLFTLVLVRKVTRRAAVRPQMQSYVTVSKAIVPGELLKPENLTLMDWPATSNLEGGFHRADEVAGRTTLYPLAPGQPVVASYLAAPGSGIGLTAKIPDGMRATALKSNEVAGVAGFLFPGSHVDVLVTYRGESSPVPMTQTVLQDAEVLTAGQKIEPDPQGKPEAVSVVTLLLSPEDAQRVVLAGSQGTIQFVLRNASDREKVRQLPIDLRQLASAAASQPTTPKAADPAPRAKSYAVETIAGDKRQVNTFGAP